MSLSTRIAIPQDTLTKVLVSSARRCCLCFGLHGDFRQKQGQIAHVDHNSSNPDFDNLAFLCLNHHDQYDSQTRQSKGFTIEELKAYRNLLYQEVERRYKSPDGIDTEKQNITMSLNAGSRIKSVRNELGIKASQFVEMLNFPSQREFEAIENGAAESPLFLLQQVHDLTGVSLDWLKHEIEPIYEYDIMPIHPISEGIKLLADLQPKNCYVTLETRTLHVGIIAELSDYKYQALELGMNLDYWNWVDQLWAFGNFYQILSILDDKYPLPLGVIIPPKYDNLLYKGKIHPRTALQHSSPRKASWPQALLDYERKKESGWYYRTHYGSWVINVQDAFKDHFRMLRENQVPKTE